MTAGGRVHPVGLAPVAEIEYSHVLGATIGTTASVSLSSPSAQRFRAHHQPTARVAIQACDQRSVALAQSLTRQEADMPRVAAVFGIKSQSRLRRLKDSKPWSIADRRLGDFSGVDCDPAEQMSGDDPLGT